MLACLLVCLGVFRLLIAGLLYLALLKCQVFTFNRFREGVLACEMGVFLWELVVKFLIKFEQIEMVLRLRTPAFVKFSYLSLYLKNNNYLQQQDSKSPFDNCFSDMPLGTL